MAKKQNLVTGLGETFDMHIEYTDSNDVPVDLTGSSVVFQVIALSSGLDIAAEMATVDDQGNIDIHIDDDQTATWPVGKTAYRVSHIDSSGNTKWLVYGSLTITDGTNV